MRKQHFWEVKIWGLLLFLFLAVLIFLPALIEYHSSKKDLLHFWGDQSRLMAKTIVRGSENMLHFDEEVFAERRNRLLADGLTLRQIDSLDYPIKQRFLRFARERIGGMVLFFNLKGKIMWPEEIRQSHRFKDDMRQRINRLISAMPADSLVQLVDPAKISFHVPPGVLIRRTSGRGFIFVLYRPMLMSKMARFHRLRRWLNQITRSPNILYIQLQRGPHIFVQSGNPLLPPLTIEQQAAVNQFKGQIAKFDDQQIFDFIQRTPDGLFVRVGISAMPLEHLQSSLIQRLVFNSLLLLIIGFIVLRIFIGRQNISFLQEKLLQIETYTGSILTNMSEGIIAVNEQGKIDLMNQWTKKNFVQNSNEPTTVDRLPFASAVRESILKFKEFSDVPLKFHDKFLLLSGRTIRFQSEETPGESKRLFLIIVRDFTSQRELEQMRSRRSKLLAMGELASRVAHEIRNPLNGIAMLAQRLQKEFTPTEHTEEFAQMTGSIRKETQRINKIVQSFLLYAKTPRLQFKQTSLTQFLQDIQPVLQANGPNPVRLSIENEAKVKIDRDQMKQVLINLIKNAMDASKEDQPIFVRLKKNGDWAQLYIEDLGQGINLENKERIFDLYFSTKDDGTGLGLSIVEKIIESHGGRVRVESPYQINGQTMQGTRFIIELAVSQI